MNEMANKTSEHRCENRKCLKTGEVETQGYTQTEWTATVNTRLL